MKTKANIFQWLASLSLLFFAAQSNAQCVGGECFLKADYVEIGVAPNGAYGSNNDAPVGYHGRIPGVGATGRALGFVADPDKDGWGVSSPGRPDYIGDYYLPGYPQEGWSIQMNSTPKSDAWRGSGSTSMTSGLIGANISCVTTGSVTTQVWQGSKGNLRITQTTVLRKDKLYFVGKILLENIGATDITDIYYNRTLDPDNEAVTPGTTISGYSTNNTIVYQPNALSTKCLVKAIGQNFNAYLGLGTKDCRAKSYICTGSGLAPTAALNDIYNHSGAAAAYTINVGASALNNDVGIGVVYNIGTLAAGQSTTLAYAYVLKEQDLDSALNETAPQFGSTGTPYAPYSTFRVCPGKKVPLNIINGGQYKWIWTPGTYLAAKGSSTLIPIGGTIPTVTGSVVYPDGAVYGDSVEVTVWGPKTYTALGISNCDTQIMTFYVDTINFSIPPSVTSPIRYCEGETPSLLSAGAASGATLNWYNSALGGVASATAPTPSTAFPIGKTVDFDTTSYWVSQTNAAGCETPRTKIDVIVTRKPKPPVVKNIIYCKGVVTQALTATGLNLKWYDAASAGTKYPTTPVPANLPAGIKSYYVTQTVNGCESDRAKLDIEISESKAVFTLSKDSLCSTELLSLTNLSTSSSSGSYTSLWSFGDGASSTDSNATHSYTDARNTYTIKLLVNNINGCQDSATKIVEVFKQPILSINANEKIICQGEKIDFSGIATAGYRSLTWDFGDGDPAYNNLQVRHAFTQAGIFNVQLKGSYPACPGISSGILIEVKAIPNVNLGRDTGICPGNLALTLKNLNSAPVDKYTWSTGDTTATIQVRNEGVYSLKAQNWRCVASDDIQVSKACYLDIPNAFTPGSGADDDAYFLPRNLLSKSAVSFDMKIFDRWGQLIFESDKTDGRGWDGTYKGQAMPLGVYVYMIQVSFSNGVSENYNGNVTLLR